MNTLHSELSESIASGKESAIKEILTKTINQTQSFELKSSYDLEILLCFKNLDILTLTAQFVAELAKNEQNRQLLTKELIVKPLIVFFTHEDASLTTQACRALGNICYDNDDARKIIGNQGLESLISVLKLNKTFHDVKLRKVACGFLLNLLMDNIDLQKAAIEYKVSDVVEYMMKQQLNNFEVYEESFTHLLLVVNMVNEHMTDLWLSSSFCSLLVDILKISLNLEISVLCLEILHGQSENNDTKFWLAKQGTCELVYDLVEKYRSKADDEECRSVLKMACDLIVLILTGDESMDFLYNNGKGKVYENMLCWLKSDDTDLLSTAVLAIGNFARNDTHCIRMVQQGIGKKLLDLLSKHNSTEEDVKLQHALLSSLRNLVIPPQNKAQVLNEGLIDILYPFLNVSHPPVVFKLLGTLRMAIDGQENASLDLLLRKDFLEKLVDWCFNSDHLGVRGEAPRLLSWLIKNCHSSKPYSLILSVKDCIRSLVEMISSNHAVMQNEAFFALTLLCVHYFPNKNKSIASGVTSLQNNIETLSIHKTQEFSALLIEANIGKNIAFIISKYKDKMEKEIIQNLLTLLDLLVNSGVIVQHLKSADLNVRKLKDNKNASNLCDKIEKLGHIIDSG